MKWFMECKTMEELKKKYRELSLKYHPDRGGDEETMKQINVEYDMMQEVFKKVSTNEAEQAERPEEFRSIINTLLNLSGLKVEICGAWLWVSGDTYINRDALKKLNFGWSKNKHMWYWRPAEAAQGRHGKPQPIDLIRAKYGSEILIGKSQSMLAG